MDIHLFRLGSVSVAVSEDYTTTTFEDGKTLTSEHRGQRGQIERAYGLGYRTAEEMNREHDLTHSLLAAIVGRDCSPTLRAIATGTVYPAWEQEEASVLSLQGYCNRLGIDIFALAKRYSR